MIFWHLYTHTHTHTHTYTPAIRTCTRVCVCIYTYTHHPHTEITEVTASFKELRSHHRHGWAKERWPCQWSAFGCFAHNALEVGSCCPGRLHQKPRLEFCGLKTDSKGTEGSSQESKARVALTRVARVTRRSRFSKREKLQ